MIRGSLSYRGGPYRFANAAPILESVSVADLVGNAHPERWDGLIDTGADRSAVPLQVCTDLDLGPRGYVPASGFDRTIRGGPYPLFWVELRIEGLGEIPLKVLGVQREIILLGRDFLRSFLALVDGPRSRWQVGRLPLWGRVLLAGLRLR